MTKRAREFRDLTRQLMVEGWRAYQLQDLEQLEDMQGIMMITNREVLYFEKTPLFFVRDKYRKEDR